MAKMLLRDKLNESEQMALAQLKFHPGFAVLTKLMDEACSLANTEMVKLDPDDGRYDEKLKNRALYARTVNDLCSSLLMSVETHVETIHEKVKRDAEDAQLEEKAMQFFEQISSAGQLQ